MAVKIIKLLVFSQTHFEVAVSYFLEDRLVACNKVRTSVNCFNVQCSVVIAIDSMHASNYTQFNQVPSPNTHELHAV